MSTRDYFAGAESGAVQSLLSLSLISGNSQSGLGMLLGHQGLLEVSNLQLLAASEDAGAQFPQRHGVQSP